LKAWHNLLISYGPEADSTPFFRDFSKFQSEFKSESISISKELLVSIYIHAAHHCDKMNLPGEKAAALWKAHEYETDPSKAGSLAWDSIIQSGIYYHSQALFERSVTLQKQHPDQIANGERVAALARLLFW